MNTIKICFWNANGIRQHKNEIEHFLINNKVDVMLISETHLSSRNSFKIKGYIIYDTKDPRDRSCGGAAILIRARLKHNIMPDLCENYLQATNICLEEFQPNLVISSVYSPPKFSITENQYINFFQSLGVRFIAAGDYNAKHTFWGSRLISPKGRILYDAISKMNLNVVSSGQPTYWPTDRRKIPDVIDFAVVKNIPKEIMHVEASLDLSSDHTPTIITLWNNNVSPAGFLTQKGNRIDWLKYKKYISTHCSENISLKSNEELDQCISNFGKTIELAIEHAIKAPTNQTRFNRIYSADIEALVREKRKARREWQEQRSPQLKIKLQKLTKRLKEVLKINKISSLKKYLESLDATPQTNYSLWRATENLKRPVIRKAPLRHPNGNWARNDTEKGTLFANHLRNVFSPNMTEESIELPPFVNQSFEPIRFEFREIENAVKTLNLRKAPGIDKMSNKMLIELPYIALRIILYIFNAITRLKYFPTQWKVSLVKMIPKPGKDHTKVDSYRPISLLPNMSKLFERVLLSKLTPLLNASGCIPNHQFGFRQKHNTIQQTHRIINVIRKAFEEKKYCSALFIDVSQAFDKVWHKGLIYKLQQIFPANIHELLESYLTNRKFILKEGDFLSSPEVINAGVPQGSILGPILYLIYTSDMPTSQYVQTSTFADDTAFISVHESPQVASQYLQDQVFILEKWLKQWRMKVNEQKCTHITFTLRKGSCPAIRINDQIIQQHTHVKYLGIHLDRRLTWKCHIEAKVMQIKLKTAQINWLIGRNSTLSLDCKLLIYNALLKPIWCYGIQLWGTASASNIEKIQRCQNKILRMITAAPWYIKNSNIHKDLKVPLVKTEIVRNAENYLEKLDFHPNPLVRGILDVNGHTRLKRKDTFALIRRQ